MVSEPGLPAPQCCQEATTESVKYICLLVVIVVIGEQGQNRIPWHMLALPSMLEGMLSWINIPEAGMGS